MTDPWTEFRSAPGARTEETAVYFERTAPDRAGRVAQWAISREPARPVGRRDDYATLARESERHLRGHRRRAVAGYLGFDAVGLSERLLRHPPGRSPFPLGEIAWLDQVRVARVPSKGLRTPRDRRSPEAPRDDTLPRPAFERSVRRLIDRIRSGEAFQVVLSHRRGWNRPEDLLDRAGELRSAERSAYFYYLRFGDREIVGASPESVVEVDGRRARVNPIAGTRPRGLAGRGRRRLTDDPKELAEHRMLVDLARNDLGRIARPGSVRLRWTESTLRVARMEHLVSRVEAILVDGVGPWEALAATLPAGTVSGAPKIRATELLRSEERTWRGPYAGTVGWVSAPSRADWALANRTGFATGDRLYTAAGAGIVHRSRPSREYDETLAKLALIESILAGGP
ncbi:MAG: chorismate-binding protein [Thermoplasmata archaeon]